MFQTRSRVVKTWGRSNRRCAPFPRKEQAYEVRAGFLASGLLSALSRLPNRQLPASGYQRELIARLQWRDRAGIAPASLLTCESAAFAARRHPNLYLEQRRLLPNRSGQRLFLRNVIHHLLRFFNIRRILRNERVQVLAAQAQIGEPCRLLDRDAE